MTPRAKLALAILALMSLVVVVYAPVIERGVFVWDDHFLLERNASLVEGSLGRLFVEPFWTADPMNDAAPAYYRPLAVLFFRFDAALGGLDAPETFHFTNVALHALAVACFVLAARRLGAGPWGAPIAGATWALLPRSSESVAWIVGRTDLLAGGLVLAAIAAWPWLRGGEGEGDLRRRGRAHLRASTAAVLLFLGLLGKETAFAGIVAIAAGMIAGRASRPLRWAYLAAPLAAYAALRSIAMAHVTVPATALGGKARALTFFEAAGRYLEMTIDAWHPTSSIGLVGEVDRLRAAFGAVVVVAVVVATALAWARLRARQTNPSPGVVVGLALAFFAIAPVLHAIPLRLAAAVTADRLLYLPLAGVALAVAVAAGRFGPGVRRALALTAAALAASFVPVTRARAAVYTDELVFRLDAAERAHPLNTGPASGLAIVLGDRVELPLACRIHARVRRVLEETGRSGTARHTRALENDAGCAAALGDYERAAEVYGTLLRAHPDAARVHMEIGYLELHRFALDRAETEFRRALAIEPALRPARRGLSDLPALRKHLLRFESPAARAAAPVAWARLLVHVGRIHEAAPAWVSLIADPATSSSDAAEGLGFLLTAGDFATLQRGATAYAARGERDAALAQRAFDKRAAVHARVEALLPRIEALVR